tara:strand:+ start:181 stop:441 length:261 start_codon:yes stop_codon:yes gene_type:complete
MTEQERIELIKNAVQASKGFATTEAVENFVAEVKTEEVFGEYGLLNSQKSDLVDEMDLLEHDPVAESIDEEDQEVEVSDEMKGVYS